MTAEDKAVIVYKICPSMEWRQAVALGRYDGSLDDARDGFIHLSTAEQLPGTAAKFFSGQTDLVLVAFAADTLGAALRWEAARGGALFPHVYAELLTRDAVWVRPLPLGADGVPQIPEDI